MFWIFLIICLVIAIPVVLFQTAAQCITDTQITSVKQVANAGNRVTFQIFYSSGRTKVETVKIGSPRYDKLIGYSL